MNKKGKEMLSFHVGLTVFGLLRLKFKNLMRQTPSYQSLYWEGEGGGYLAHILRGAFLSAGEFNPVSKPVC